MKPPVTIRLAPAATVGSSSDDSQSLTLDQMFEAYAPLVARVCFRILGRRDAVDDLVQQTFLVAHRDLAQLRNSAAARAWLLTIATRLARRHLRIRKLKQWLHLESIESYTDVAGPSASPDDRLMFAAIYRVLERLPANDRAAWILRHIEGEPLERVARLCGCSLATAKRRIARTQAIIEAECGDE